MSVDERIVIVGAGQAGGDVATGLRKQGYAGHIDLVGDEAHPPYQRPPLSKGFLQGKVALADLYIKPPATYERLNIELRTGARVDAIDRGAREVSLRDGSRLPYDKLVLAIGDCANQPSAYTGGRVRLESVPNAMEHARVAVATLMGKREPSAAVPWFWSDQHGVKLQMVGLSAGYDQCVTRGPVPGKELAAFYLKDKRVIAADVIGRPAEFNAARKLVSSRAEVDAARLADASVPLASITA
jgi:NADPH-dependent 2,4-dienoyl-CoA reductase/sulfur reductase-like enzyme